MLFPFTEEETGMWRRGSPVLGHTKQRAIGHIYNIYSDMEGGRCLRPGLSASPEWPLHVSCMSDGFSLIWAAVATENGHRWRNRELCS